MARTLSEIYTDAVAKRDEYLGTKNLSNSSKMSVLDAFTYVVSSSIWTLENLMDVFRVDVAEDIQQRVNGTPAYYVNALLKYQHGDSLRVSDDGTKFGYLTVDPTKRLVTKAAYQEYSEEGYFDKRLELKVVKGKDGEYEQLTYEEVVAVNAYIKQIAFAGTNINVVSRKGDILIPRLVVYYDGQVSTDEMYRSISESLNKFTASLNFNSTLHYQQVISAILQTPHVTDVYDSDAGVDDNSGVFVIKFDDNNEIMPSSYDIDGNPVSYEHKVVRYTDLSSGFLRESTGEGDEEQFPVWSKCITLMTEDR